MHSIGLDRLFSTTLGALGGGMTFHKAVRLSPSDSSHADEDLPATSTHTGGSKRVISYQRFVAAARRRTMACALAWGSAA